MTRDRTEQAKLLALVKNAGRDWPWHEIASVVEEAGGATAVIESRWSGFQSFDTDAVEQLAQGIHDQDIEEMSQLIETQLENDVGLTTVMDDDYPENLRQIYNRPPFLFFRGSLVSKDSRSIAVVGTRLASAEGLERAESLARELSGRDIVVLSGLAKGIDTAAHAAAIEAHGRTIAVMGTGIDIVYPKENASLAKLILDSGGALVSQFWPGSPPTSYSFPMRNVVMSGLAIGTAVMEANSRSGAKMQARLALEHGKRLFLHESLVEHEEWARKYAQRPGAIVISSVEDIISIVESFLAPPAQLALG